MTVALCAAGGDGGWFGGPAAFWKLCLDVVNGGKTDGMLHMTELRRYSGQHWKME